MRVPKWLVIVVLSIGLVALAEAGVLFYFTQRLDTAEKKIERVADNVAEFAYLGPSEKKSEQVPTQVSKPNSDRLRALELDIKAVNERLSALARSGPNTADLEEIVDRKLGEKLISAVTAPRDQKAPQRSFAAISKELDLTVQQQQAIKDAIDRVKENMTELTTLSNSEDKEFVKELNTLFTAPLPPEQKTQKIKRLLSSRTPPGRDETYFDLLGRFRNETFDDLRQSLTEEQFSKLKAMRLNPFAIEIIPAPVD